MSDRAGAEQTEPTLPRVLIVDDDPLVVDALTEHLTSGRKGEKYAVSSCLGGHEALALLSDSGQKPFDVVMTDLSMPGMTGLELLRELRRRAVPVSVIVMTGYGTVESAVECLRSGAVDYLTKPVVDDELRMSLGRALRERELMKENRGLRQRLDRTFALANILGNDARMEKVFGLVEAVAPSKTTVLMCGESGTGKSLIAHAIHHHSPRKDKPFVEISCGSIPETLLESELFGHVKGAFTGAHADKVGRFSAANGGTIFLDEINSASPAMQLKLLRVLQERKFEPVGSSQTIEADVRVILASNQPLEGLVAAGTFRQDLYYRINVVKIELPPLRERTADIPDLAAFFLEKFGNDLGKKLVGFTPEAVDALCRYAYPGNVRELQNVIERAAVLCRGQTVELHDLPEQVLGAKPQHPTRTDPLRMTTNDAPWTPMTLEDALRPAERAILIKALEANNWNRQRTAEQLGMNRTTLYKKMIAHGLMGDERRAG